MSGESSRNVLASPVRSEATPAERPGPTKGIALCLSGGGYRAMLFHVGSLLRLNEAGILGFVRRISSVSGGSITAGVLGLSWKSIGFVNGSAQADKLWSGLVEPIRVLAGR